MKFISPYKIQLFLQITGKRDDGELNRAESQPPKEKKPFEMPVKNDNMRRVYGYLLNGRGIDRNVLNAFVHKRLIYESEKYHNAVFVGLDNTGKPVHVHLRGTISNNAFKGNAESCIPEYSFHWNGTSDKVFLFEAPIDMLSYISLHKQGWEQHSYAACCGVSDLVLFQMLKDNPKLKTVVLCLDNDEAGHKAINRIRPKLEARIAEEKYGYNISVIDLRNPTKSHGNNLLHLVNKYMDLYAQKEELIYKAKAEKYAKIISKTIIMSGTDASSFGQNAYFYNAAEGLLTATILLVAEFCPPKKRHIVSVFKIIQELLAPFQKKGKNQFQQLMELLPDDHKAKWFAGAALNTAEQSMASVMSTALSRLNTFLDSELEQLLCFDIKIDAEKFCNEKSAIFVILPEENPNTFFMVSLIIQQLYREILAVADETGGKLKNRCIFFCDEFGTLPKIESAEMMFSASRSRRLQIVPIIQSFAQLEKNMVKREQR